jgi:lipid-A-disaccharide synthase
LGIPIIYYISPQIWAWGKKRVGQIERLVDKMLLILPFETDFYNATTVNHSFVGHYLLEDIQEKYISSPVTKEGNLLLMPGSRPQEVERMLPVMLEAASLFQQKHKIDIKLAGVDNSHCRAIYDRYLSRAGAPLVSTHIGQTRKLIYESSLVLTASGTATLETAIIGRPMVVIYKTGFITYQIAKRVIELDKIALVNLVLNDKVVPELVQHEAKADRIASELEKLAGDRDYRGNLIDKLHKVPALLGGAGASERAAEEICRFMC